MDNEQLSDLFKQSQSFLAPIVKTNKLAVTNFEKLVAFQMNTLQSYMDFSIDRLKAAAEVDSPERLQDFLTGQFEAVAVLGQKLLDDSKALAELSAEFRDEFSQRAEENIGEATAKAGKAADKVVAATR
jgi:phasin family protein